MAHPVSEVTLQWHTLCQKLPCNGTPCVRSYPAMAHPVSEVTLQWHTLCQKLPCNGHPVSEVTLQWHTLCQNLPCWHTLCQKLPCNHTLCQSFRAESCTDMPASSIFSSPVMSIFSAMHFDVPSSSTCQCEKEDRKAEGFQILHFYCSLSNDILAVRGLIMWVGCGY